MATTIVLFRSTPLHLPTWPNRLAAWPGRSMLLRRYLRAYRRLLPLDKPRLQYYIAWAALRRLCAWGRWLRAGPVCTGSKPSSVRYLSADRVDILRDAFRWRSGVDTKL
jgi:hypothetical protein